MIGSYILLDIELGALKDFLDHVIQESREEIGQIIQQNEEEKFNHYDDFHNALFYPLERQQIAVRAVLYEVTALIDSDFDP